MEQFIINLFSSFIGSAFALIIIGKPLWDHMNQMENVFAWHIAKLQKEVEDLRQKIA